MNIFLNNFLSKQVLFNTVRFVVLVNLLDPFFDIRFKVFVKKHIGF